MNCLSNYEAQEEYNRFQRLVNETELLSEEEYEFIIKYDETQCDNLLYRKYRDANCNKPYLNLNVYSEIDEDNTKLKMERGV